VVQSSFGFQQTSRIHIEDRHFSGGFMRSLRIAVSGLLLLILFLTPVLAQQRVDPKNLYVRVICIQPMIGKGTSEDPRRPALVPKPGVKASIEGILGYSYQSSDDGKWALVEYVARNREALLPLLEETKFTVKSFEKGKYSRSAIEKELRRYKQDFDLDTLGVSVP
jgi:hypothetical protein